MGTMAYSVGTPRPINNIRRYLRSKIKEQRGLRTAGQEGFTHRIRLDWLDTRLNLIGRLHRTYLWFLDKYCLATGAPREFSYLPFENVRIRLGQRRERIKTIGPDRRSLDDSPGLSVCYVNSKGMITGAKKVFRDLLGYDETEMVGKSFDDFIHPDHLAGLMERKPLYEFRMKKKDGEYATVRARKRILAGVEDIAWLITTVRKNLSQRSRILRINLEGYLKVLNADPRKLPLRKHRGNLGTMVSEVVDVLREDFERVGVAVKLKAGRVIYLQADTLVLQSAIYDILKRVIENANLQTLNYGGEKAEIKIKVWLKSVFRRSIVTITGPQSLLMWATREGDTNPFSDTCALGEVSFSRLRMARQVVEGHGGSLRIIKDIFNNTVILISLPYGG